VAGAITRTTAKYGDGSEVVVYRLPEMGHSWPGATAGALSAPDAGIRATDLICGFFASHSR
jgi:polyhydroxybutyrate depolymerase